MMMRKGACVCVAVLLLLGIICHARDITHHDLGRSVKMRILVDKTMLPTNDWVTEPWMIEEAKQAGFNVFVPRSNHDDLHNVKRVAYWCKRRGMFYMPWMRGTLRAPSDTPDGKKLVWDNGVHQPLWSPNSDEFWEWTNKYIVQYAKISAKNENFIGVFLDYEIYAPKKQGNAYALSYDDIILKKFAEARDIELPDLAFDERKEWLVDHELHEAFEEFQIAHWRQRCRNLREVVDEHNPRFQFCIYPAPGTLFMQQATYPEWATEEAPLILADAVTYGRPSEVIPEADAVEANRERLAERVQVPREAGIPFQYVGGIDPCVRGADPEFVGKDAVLISDLSDGYWVFYECAEYDKDHRDYFRWFQWANDAIEKRNFAAQYAPRKTPDTCGLKLFRKFDDWDALSLPEVTGEMVEFSRVTMRRENLVLLVCEKNKPVTVTLSNVPVGSYKCPMMWAVVDRDMQIAAQGKIAHDSDQVVSFTPEYSGIYLLDASAGRCSFAVSSANVPVGLYTGETLSLIESAPHLYLHVPAGVKRLTCQFEGVGRETVRINAISPAGEIAESAQTTFDQHRQTLDVPVGDYHDAVWALQVTKADEGVLEDSSLTLAPNLPPVVSLVPEHVFDFNDGG
ncbi:MAG: hypothetical protein R6V19_10975 [Armatimonadota bacterium]